MIIGTTLFKLDGGTAYYSPEFPRGGLSATFVVDVTHLVGTPTVVLSIEHRNPDETTFSALGTFANITTVGVKDIDLTGCKEVLRFKFEFDAGDAATDGIHFLMMAPSWRPYA